MPEKSEGRWKSGEKKEAENTSDVEKEIAPAALASV